MSYIRVMSSLAGKAFTSNNRLIFGKNCWPQISTIRFISIFEKLSREKPLTVPKKPKSGYTLFFTEISPKVKAENPGFGVTLLAKKIAEEWNKLDKKTKEEYVERGKNNTINYKTEKEKWIKSLTEEQIETLKMESQAKKRALAKRRLKSLLKKLNFPIRPQTAYNIYFKEAIAKRPVDKEHMKERFIQISADWHKLTEEEKIPFVESYKLNKLRYLEEMQNWKNDISKPENEENLKKLVSLRAKASLGSSKRIPKKKGIKAKKTKKVKKLAKRKSSKTKTKAKSKLTKAKSKSTKAKSKSTKAKSKSTKAKSKSTKAKTKSTKSTSKGTKVKKSSKKEEKAKTDEVVDESSSSSEST